MGSYFWKKNYFIENHLITTQMVKVLVYLQRKQKVLSHSKWPICPTCFLLSTAAVNIFTLEENWMVVIFVYLSTICSDHGFLNSSSTVYENQRYPNAYFNTNGKNTKTMFGTNHTESRLGLNFEICQPFLQPTIKSWDKCKKWCSTSKFSFSLIKSL